MTPLGLVLGGAALVGVGVGIGAHLAGRRTHNPRDLEYIAYLVGEIVEAEQMIERFTDKGFDPFPNRVRVPPRVWRALQEVRENREAN